MKKLIMFVLLFVTVFAFAREVVATWTSTCGWNHTTTFTGNWSNSQIAEYIALVNEVGCGVRPKVNIN